MEGGGGYIQLGENGAPRGTFLYAGPVLAPNSSSAVYGRSSNSSGTTSANDNNQHAPMPFDALQLGECFRSSDTPPPRHFQRHHHAAAVKSEASGSQQDGHHRQRFQYQSGVGDGPTPSEVEAIKAKIVAHPHYSSLLQAYMECQKVGAPPEVATRLAVARREVEARQLSLVGCEENSKDPELDQFMEAYYDMLVKYREELTRPIQEAMDFMHRIESQLNMLTNGTVRVFPPDDKCEGIGSSEDDHDNSGGETELPEIDPRAEDRELKNHLLKKYSGYLSSLKQELSKKKKKGKLPKDARQKLLTWWELHYKWPYPSETEKVALAESTGLDQKQINNWFINQRKRHWKPSEDMQFMVMDGLHPQSTSLYMEGHYMGDGTYRLGPG